MSQTIDWASAPKNALGALEPMSALGTGKGIVFITHWSRSIGRFFNTATCDGRQLCLDGAAWRLIPRPAASAWDGQGLPPAGLEIEVRKASNHRWKPGVVLFSSEYHTVFRVDGVEHSERTDDIEMRPRLTPEQVKAEEQALADLLVNAARPELYRMEVNEAWRTLARAVLDAGYRKVGDQ